MSRNGGSVCLICLKRFGREAVSQDGEDKHQYGENRTDLYSNFLVLTGRYLKVVASKSLLRLVKQRKSLSGQNVETFCAPCQILVGNICDLYAEFQVVKFKLLWRVEELENVTRQAEKTISTKLARGLFRAVAKQLDIKSVTRLELFRKNMMINCHQKVKSSNPQVLVSRGEDMFTFSETKRVLMRLILVFALAAAAPRPTNLEKEKGSDKGTIHSDKTNTRGKSGATLTSDITNCSSEATTRRPKRKAASNYGRLKEKECPENPENERTLSGDDGNNGDADSDWEAGAASPAESVDFSAVLDINVNSQSDDDFISRPCKKARKTRPQRLELGIVKIICQEDGDEDDITEDSKVKTTKKRYVKDPSWKCKKCNNLYGSHWHLNRHLKDVHKQPFFYKCKLCLFKGTITVDQLKKHNQDVHQIRPRTRRKGGDKPPDKVEILTELPCPKCPRTFARVVGLAVHMLAIHKSRLEQSCRMCDYKTTSSEDMLLHKFTVHRKTKEEMKNYEEEAESRKQVKALRNIRDTDQDHFSSIPCEVCQIVCESGPSLRKHLNQEHEQIPFEQKTVKCDMCSMKFAHKQTWELHCVQTHLHKFKFVCDANDCTEHFLNHVDLNKHLETVHLEPDMENPTTEAHYDNLKAGMSVAEAPPEKLSSDNQAPQPPPTVEKVKSLVYCKTCQCGFVNPDILELHELTHTVRRGGSFPYPKSAKVYKCPQAPKCKVKSINPLRVVGHHNLVHGKKVQAYKCLECPKKYYANEGLLRHLKKHENSEAGAAKKKARWRVSTTECQKRKRRSRMTRQERYLPKRVPCPFLGCRRAFSDKHKLLRHQMEHNPSNHIACPEEGCGKKFSNKQKVNVHLKREHGSGERYPCSICGACYISAAVRNHHEKYIHVPSKQFECDICHNKYKQLGALTSHKRRAHNPDPLANNLICSECGSVFKTNYGLKYHIESVHTSQDQKKFACPYCPYKSHRKGLFRMHLNTCLKNKGLTYDEEKWGKLPAAARKLNNAGPRKKPGRKPGWIKRRQSGDAEEEEEMEDKSTTEDEGNDDSGGEEEKPEQKGQDGANSGENAANINSSVQSLPSQAYLQLATQEDVVPANQMYTPL